MPVLAVSDVFQLLLLDLLLSNVLLVFFTDSSGFEIKYSSECVVSCSE